MAELEKNLALLKAACDDPKRMLEKYLSEGKQVIGCFAPYTPEQLVCAAGMVPMGLWGGQTEYQLAKSYLPAFACPVMQANMEFGLSGVYKGLSAVIIPAICDTLRCMTQNWRFGVKEIPMIPIVYPQNRKSRAAVDYLVSEFEAVLVMLATITGNMVSEASLSRAIRIYNAHNAVMREFCDTANDHLDVITPSVRHMVMKSAWFFDKEEHTEIMRGVIDGLKALPRYDYPGKRVVLTGIACEPDALLDIFAENGIAVVGDDLAQESRQYRTDAPESGGGALKRLAAQWMLRTGCSLIHEDGKPRGPMLVKLCRDTGADGVVLSLMKFCDPEEYDVPYFMKDLKAAGIPCLSFETDQLGDSLGQTATRIESFAEILS